MKKLLIGLLFAASVVATLNAENCDECSCKATSRTFFYINPPYRISTPEFATLNRDRMDKREDGRGFMFQATVLGGKSTKSENLARYFLPNCKQTLHVVEQTNVPNTDVLANHLNIYTVDGTFDSMVTFKPQHSFVGVGLTFGKRFWEKDDGRSWFWLFNAPILRVHNRVRLCEDIENAGGGAVTTPINNDDGVFVNSPTQAVANVVEAFQQPAWHFGRIIDNDCEETITCPEGHNTKTRFADIEFVIGGDLIKHETCSLNTFGGIVIPSGNRPKAVTMFEPIVGHNKHFGVLGGCNYFMEIWHHKTKDCSLNVALNMHTEYFFERHETRSFDLKNKPWSRYMQFYESIDQATFAASLCDSDQHFTAVALHTPGIDLLTQELRVFPGFTHTYTSGLVYRSKAMELEVGYMFFARQAECVKFDCGFPTGAALKSLLGCGETNPIQQIGDQFGNDCQATPLSGYTDNVITPADVDLHSAEHPGYMTHTMYGSAGYRWDEREYPMELGIGGSYEFPPDNTGLNRWTVWGKFNISF